MIPNDSDVPVAVPSGGDRYGETRRVFGTLPISVKVAARETGGNLLIVEQNNRQKGGPPRHLHNAQDEWFYVVRGQYIIEINGAAHPLGPGDSILAPRNVSHTWAFVGDEPGTLLVTFQPADRMEGFFAEATQLTKLPDPAHLAALFARHGMQLTGPPLAIPAEQPLSVSTGSHGPH